MAKCTASVQAWAVKIENGEIIDRNTWWTNGEGETASEAIDQANIKMNQKFIQDVEWEEQEGVGRNKYSHCGNIKTDPKSFRDLFSKTKK